MKKFWTSDKVLSLIILSYCVFIGLGALDIIQLPK